MATATAQTTDKDIWGDLAPRIIPIVIEALLKSYEPQKVLPQDGVRWPWNFPTPFPPPLQTKQADEDAAKFWNIAIPIITSVVPAVINALTKSGSFSVGANLASPLGGVAAGGSLQIGKGGADEKRLADVIRVVGRVLPDLIGAIAKGPADGTPISNEKFLELLPVILPPLIEILTR